MIEYKVAIQIDKIKVDERYYYFNWKAIIGKKNYRGKYDNSYEGHTQQTMQKILEKGYALDIVLAELAQNRSENG